MNLSKLTSDLLTIFFILFYAYGFAEEPIKWNVRSNNLGNQEYEVTITANLESGWHLYSQFLESDEGPLSTYITYNLNGVSKLLEQQKKLMKMNLILFGKWK